MIFKVGDTVRRTGCTFGSISPGDERRVARTHVNDRDEQVAIGFMSDPVRYSSEFFELVRLAEDTPAPAPNIVHAIDAAIKTFGPELFPEADTYIAKRDQGKPQFDLLTEGCPQAQLGLVRVLTWAVEVKGYKPHSWQTVPEAIRRYTAALHRHLNAKARGERYDAESGLLHDLHVLACATFLAELEARADKKAT